MPDYKVRGLGPVHLSAEGQQFSVPLSTLYFDASGRIKTDRWPGYGGLSDVQKSVLDQHVDDLARQRHLTPGSEWEPQAPAEAKPSAAKAGGQGAAKPATAAVGAADPPKPTPTDAKDTDAT